MISWKPEYSVGIEELDTQHQKMFEILNVLNDAVEAGDDVEADFFTVRLLRYYSEYHFNSEEQLMEKYHYLGLDEHKEEHEKFKAHVYGLKKEFPDDKILLASRLKEFVQEWVIEHILGTDKKYSSFLIEKIENNPV